MSEPEVHDTTARARRVGRADVAVTSMGDAMITREVAQPGWRWSKDVKPIVGTDFCRAFHQLFVVSGHLHVMMDDGAEFDVRAGDAAVIPPGHDAWVVGDESCDMLDFSPDYVQLIGARRLSGELGDLVDRVNAEGGHGLRFDLTYDADGHPDNYYCRSDHYMYARFGIPIAFFTTGSHPDYHQLTDEPQYIDFDKLARLTRFIGEVTRTVADLDDRPVVDKPKPDPEGVCKQ